MRRPFLAILALLSFAASASAMESYAKRFAVSEDTDSGHYGDSRDTAPIGGEPSLTDYGFRSDAYDPPDGSFVRQPEPLPLENSSQCIDIDNDNSDAMDGYYDWFEITAGCA